MMRLSVAKDPALLFFIAIFCGLPLLSPLSTVLYNGFPGMFVPLLAIFIFRQPERFSTFRHTDIDKPLLAWIGGLLLLGLASALWSPDPLAAAERVGKVFAILICSIAVFHWSRPLGEIRQRRLHDFFMAGFAGGCVFLAIELLFNHPLYRLSKWKPFDEVVLASVVNPGCVVLALAYWPFLYLMLKTGRLRQGLAAGAALFILLLTAGSSETALVAFAGGSAVLTATLYAPWLSLVLLGSSLLFVIGAMPWMSIYAYQTAGDFLSAWKEASAGQRLEIWHDLSRHALQNPLYGHGVEASRLLKDIDFTNIHYSRTQAMHPHNNVVQLWLEFGVLGAMWAVGFTLFILSRIKKLATPERAFAAALLTASFAVALFGYGLWQSWWLSLAIVSAATLRFAFYSCRMK